MRGFHSSFNVFFVINPDKIIFTYSFDIAAESDVTDRANIIDREIVVDGDYITCMSLRWFSSVLECKTFLLCLGQELLTKCVCLEKDIYSAIHLRKLFNCL